MFSLLFDLARNAPLEPVRVLAIDELTRLWSDDPRTLSLLDSLDVAGQPEAVRKAASFRTLIRKRQGISE